MKQSAANLPSVTLETMDQRLVGSLVTDRMIAELSGASGALAIILVCIGVYGIADYTVSARTHEIGIRIALGAQRSKILWLVFSQWLLLVLIGFAIGVPAAFAAGTWISLLFGVRPGDPIGLSIAVALIFTVGALASYIPARHAMRVDPMVALRHE